MNLARREFLLLLVALGAGTAWGVRTGWKDPEQVAKSLYDFPPFGDVRLLHFTDSHAQLEPTYYREPNVNLGVGTALGKEPHLVGKYFLEEFGFLPGSAHAYAFTSLDFAHAAKRYGALGGFAHLATLINRLRDNYQAKNTLLLDGGDTWQGSATALWSTGKDMVDVCNALKVDAMTGHWEFTYGEEVLRANIKRFQGEFLAHNVSLTEEAQFEDKPAYDAESGHVFKPYTIRTLGKASVAIIGQAFPYTPVANPRRFVPDWTFGIREEELQSLVRTIREREKPDVVVLLSHNGMDVDLRLASRVSGLDAVLGGHTHDGVPEMVEIKNSGGVTLVGNAGSSGKFLAVLDLQVGVGKVRDYRYRLLPVFSELLPAHPEVQAVLQSWRAPHQQKLSQKLAISEDLLYRRGNFSGTFDQLICDSLLQHYDAQIALSPGFRWGGTILPGQAITVEDIYDLTGITYPETYSTEMSGEQLMAVFEDVADNLFNRNPYYQQGGDMVRVAGLRYAIEPGAENGKRISDMRLADGTPLRVNKRYKVAGWGTVNSIASGPPVWDVLADYLRAHKRIAVKELNQPKLLNVGGNPGYVTGG